MNNIKEIVEKFRVHKDLSLLKIAEEANITEATLHSIFQRNDAKASYLEGISKVLEIPVTRFFENSEPEENAKIPVSMDKENFEKLFNQEKKKNLELQAKIGELKEQKTALDELRLDYIAFLKQQLSQKDNSGSPPIEIRLNPNNCNLNYNIGFGQKE